MKRFLVRVAGVLAIAGCDGSTDPIVCPAVTLPGIIVEIRDAATGAPVAAMARGAAREGAYVDSLVPHARTGEPPVLLSRSAAWERPGTYTVEVVHDGYQPWTATDVTVRRGRCNVATVELQAALEPLP